MARPILSHFENLFKKKFSKLITKKDFNLHVGKFLADLYTKDLDNVIKEVYDLKQDSKEASLIDLTKNLISFSESVLPELDLSEDELNQAKLNLEKVKETTDLHQQFVGWQKFFKELMSKKNNENKVNENKVIELLWEKYLAKQAKTAYDPYSRSVKDSFDGYVYQVNADALKRLGGLVFELLSEFVNASVYLESKGNQKLFNQVEKDGTSSDVQGLQKLWRATTGNEHTPPPMLTPKIS